MVVQVRKGHEEQLQGPAALGTDDGYKRLQLGLGKGQSKAMGQLNQRADLFQCYRAAGVHKAIVTNLHEPCWQHMLEKATDELQHLQSESPPTVATGFAIAERNSPILDRDDAVIGYGHPKDIGRRNLARKIFDSAFTGK